MMEFLSIILLGRVLLHLTEEAQFIVYIKLAIFLSLFYLISKILKYIYDIVLIQ